VESKAIELLAEAEDVVVGAMGLVCQGYAALGS
jgi:hypothetical protein